MAHKPLQPWHLVCLQPQDTSSGPFPLDAQAAGASKAGTPRSTLRAARLPEGQAVADIRLKRQQQQSKVSLSSIGGPDPPAKRRD